MLTEVTPTERQSWRVLYRTQLQYSRSTHGPAREIATLRFLCRRRHHYCHYILNYHLLLIFEAEGTDCLHAPPPGS